VSEAEKLVPAKISYNWDVAPILSNNCFRCHGNDAGKRKAGLRLDMAANAYAPVPEHKAHRAIVPHNPGASELVRRIRSSDPDVRMPPKETHKVLSPVEIATLTRWIEQGAEYEELWSYIPPKTAAPQHTEFDKQAVNDIDRYIYARLQKVALRPSPEADRETLINRVTLDLTGLPPTLQEVDAFLADEDPNAYEHLVDLLLASPAYGERMASTWMDVARYAETDGYLDDLHDRLFYPWRDWVVSAFNRNMPYNQFATWQLAGDLLPNPNKEQILATVFGRLGKRSTENGIIDEEYRVDYRNERSEMVGKAFLGLTVGCAKCHDHKYDVISQKDYYAFAGFFNSIDERGFYAPAWTGRNVGPTLAWPSAQQQTELNATTLAVQQQEAAYNSVRAQAAGDAELAADQTLQRQPGAIVTTLKASVDAATAAYYPLDGDYEGPIDQFKVLRPSARALPRPRPAAEIQAEAGKGPPARMPQLPSGIVEADVILTPSPMPAVGPGGLERPVFIPGVKGHAFLVSDNRGWLAPKVGWYERNQDFSVDLWIKPRAGAPYKDATVFNHQDHTIWTGDAGYTLNLEDNHLRFDVIHMSPSNMVSVKAVQPVDAGQWTHVTVTYDGSSRAGGVKLYVNGLPVQTEVKKDHLTRTILPTLLGGTLGGDYYGFSFGKRFRAEEFNGGALDELRIFGRALSPLEVRYLQDADGVATENNTELRAQLVNYLTDTDPRVVQAKAELRDAREAENKVASSIPEILVMADTEKPRPTYVLDHGLYDQPKDEVKPAGLDRVFSWKPSKYAPNRLGLAEWLFDPENPVTARVFVNRLWASHFGTGIVETVDDFGTQGSKPSNPELLDYLAVEFVKSGWDIKHMQKLIVMSAVYRQSSALTAEIAEKDPRNLLLARGPRYRLPAEVIRDNALAASGLLVKTVGGASVYPYQPAGVWEAALSLYGYSTDVPADDNHRRSMYTYVKRTAEAPSMVIFDFADRNVSAVARRISNSPLQALDLLNDPQFLEAYRVLAERVIRGGGSTEAQIQQLFRLATRRHANSAEMPILLNYHRAQTTRLSENPDKVQKLAHVGVQPVDGELDPVQVAAMTMVAATVFNSPDAYSLR